MLKTKGYAAMDSKSAIVRLILSGGRDWGEGCFD